MGRPALRVEWTLQRARQGAGPSELILKRPKTQKSRRECWGQVMGGSCGGTSSRTSSPSSWS
jgi:hypothetical protein